MNSTPAEPKRNLRWTYWTLGALGLVCLAATVLFGAKKDSQLSTLFASLFGALWPFFLTILTGTILYEKMLRQSFVEELKSVAGPEIISALPEGVSTSALLDHVYGGLPANKDLAQSLLGGSGEFADGRGLTFSTNTAVKYVLKDTDVPANYSLTSEVKYRFSRPVKNTKFVIIATSDSLIKDLAVLGCEMPLYELWFVSDSGLFAESIQRMSQGLTIEIASTDKNGQRRSTHRFGKDLTKVPIRQWKRYLRFFGSDMGPIKELDPRKYKSSVEIFVCNLSSDNLDETYFHDAINELKLVSSTLQPKSDEFCYWTAPYPCLVRDIRFEAHELTGARGEKLKFRSELFAIKGSGHTSAWVPAAALDPIQVNSWMLPGHGACLLWTDASTEMSNRADDSSGC